MDSNLIPIFAISIGGLVAITYMILDFVSKKQKSNSSNSERDIEVAALSGEVDRLKSHNNQLQKRIENLEAIVVDNDLENFRTEFKSYDNAAGQPMTETPSQSKEKQ